MKLIGISGKIGSGKDLAAEMVRYIQYKERIKNGTFYHGPIISSFSEWEDGYTDEMRRLFSCTQIEKFGGKIKDIVCVLLNCSRNDLEDREFKESALSENWWYYVFGGSNTTRMLNINDWLSLSDNQKGYYQLVKTTPRLLLQLMGTECGREIIHPDIWVNATLEPYEQQLDWAKLDPDGSKKYPNWVISDVRFHNEVDAIEELGGIVIRIERDNVNTSKIDKHESETALDKYQFEYVIENNGTKDELLKKIEKIIENKFGKTK